VIRFCTSTVLYAEQPLERACAEIASLGISAVDIWHVRGWCEHLAGGPDAVAAMLQRHGLGLEAVSAYNTPLSEVAAWLPVAAGLGGHAVVTGSTPPETSVVDFAAQIAPLVRRATELGVCLAIENHGHATIDSIASMVELTRLLPEDGLGIALAPIHLWNRDEQTADAIRALGDRIAVMYLWDWGGVNSCPFCLTKSDNRRSCRPCRRTGR
jgi:sugar phosphate isomerase/epimerase